MYMESPNGIGAVRKVSRREFVKAMSQAPMLPIFTKLERFLNSDFSAFFSDGDIKKTKFDIDYEDPQSFVATASLDDPKGLSKISGLIKTNLTDLTHGKVTWITEHGKLQTRESFNRSNPQQETVLVQKDGNASSFVLYKSIDGEIILGNVAEIFPHFSNKSSFNIYKGGVIQMLSFDDDGLFEEVAEIIDGKYQVVMEKAYRVKSTPPTWGDEKVLLRDKIKYKSLPTQQTSDFHLISISKTDSNDRVSAYVFGEGPYSGKDIEIGKPLVSVNNEHTVYMFGGILFYLTIENKPSSDSPAYVVLKGISSKGSTINLVSQVRPNHLLQHLSDGNLFGSSNRLNLIDINVNETINLGRIKIATYGRDMEWFKVDFDKKSKGIKLSEDEKTVKFINTVIPEFPHDPKIEITA